MAEQFDIKDIERRMEGALASLKTEFTGLRTGRASVHLLDTVQVSAYGSMMPLNQVASVSAPEARMLAVNVWDKSQVGAVDRAIREAPLGLNPIMDGQTLRIPIPALSEERRKELAKLAGKFSENARIAVRNVRRDGMELLKRLEKAGDINEDRQKVLSTDVQKATDKFVAQIDEALKPQRRRDHAGVSEPSPILDRTAVADIRPPPRHLAIIMDGNGRWAKARGLPRAMGHREGVEALRRTVEAAVQLGISHLTVFSFSTENWSRPQSEIDALFDLLRMFVKRDLAQLHRDGVRIRIIGSRAGLSADIIDLIDEAVTLTRDNTRLTLNIAFNYGGRGEIVAAVQSIAKAVQAGNMRPEDIDEKAISRLLWSSNRPILTCSSAPAESCG